MATLERIRSRAGIIVAAVIGLALLAFVMQDLFDSRTSLFKGTKLEVGEISGSSVSYQDMEAKINEITEIYKMNSQQSNIDEKTLESIREQAWEQMVNEKVMGDEYNELGLVVSSDELNDLVQGQNPHSIITQMFTNPETGQFSKQFLAQFLKAKNQDQTGKQQAYWLFVEQEIIRQQLNTKYANAIKKGLTVPTFMAKADFIDNSKKVDASFIVERFNTVSDSAIKVTKDDLKKYYNEHKYLYEQENAKDVEYVTFDVVPSADDQKDVQDWITKTKPEFEKASDAELFVNQNSDVSYADKNYKVEDLSDSLKNFIAKASVGGVYGPYLEGGSYKLAKYFKDVVIPDTVKARHILIRPKGQTKEDAEKAKKMADSLKIVIEKGGDFAALALQYSEDRSNSAKGGDLGWFREGSMVKPFNDAAFNSKKNEIKVVETNYGYHILQVIDRGKEIKKYKVAFVERKITPSTRTFEIIFAKATKFAGENDTYEKFNASITKQNLNKKLATFEEGRRNVTGLQSERVLARWVFENKKGVISEPLDLQTTYVVAVITQVKKKGIAPLEQVRNEVEVAVRKQMKAEKLAEKIKAVGSVSQIQDLAAKLNVSVEAADGVNFTAYTFGNAGFEPKIIAYALGLPKGKISEPIEGMGGVFVVVVNNITEPGQSDYKASSSRLNSYFQSRVGYEMYAALRKLADIKDERVKFY
jgi:peptidyl-prolyl cis-trans isomerase D